MKNSHRKCSGRQG